MIHFIRSFPIVHPAPQHMECDLNIKTPRSLGIHSVCTVELLAVAFENGLLKRNTSSYFKYRRYGAVLYRLTHIQLVVVLNSRRYRVQCSYWIVEGAVCQSYCSKRCMLLWEIAFCSYPRCAQRCRFVVRDAGRLRACVSVAPGVKQGKPEVKVEAKNAG